MACHLTDCVLDCQCRCGPRIFALDLALAHAPCIELRGVAGPIRTERVHLGVAVVRVSEQQQASDCKITFDCVITHLTWEHHSVPRHVLLEVLHTDGEEVRLQREQLHLDLDALGRHVLHVDALARR
jgi:hypothetical protein